MSSTNEVLDLEVPCDERAPANVREALSGLDSLDSLGWVLGDVMLVASELVTNAVLHSGCSGHDMLHIEASLGSRKLNIAVSDPGRSQTAAQMRSDRDEEAIGGWGLQIVDALADQWGSERSGRYRVWADIPVAGAEGTSLEAPHRVRCPAPRAVSHPHV